MKTPEEIFKEFTGIDITEKTIFTNLVIDKGEFIKMYNAIHNQAIKDAAGRINCDDPNVINARILELLKK